MREELILVDRKDKGIGVADKMEAHKNGALHRAFSIFVFDSERRLIVQQRAKKKYHSGGLWSNTCCSHPFPGESTEQAAHRRLKEEMGFDCRLKEIASFIYRAELGNGLTEHEFDHIFLGFYDGEVKPNRKEVAEARLLSLHDLKEDMKRNPDKYTPWFRIIMETNIDFGF